MDNRIFQSLSSDGRWIKMGDKKKTLKEKTEAGIPVRILHPNGGFFTIANADKLPEGVPAKFSAKAESEYSDIFNQAKERL